MRACAAGVALPCPQLLGLAAHGYGARVASQSASLAPLVKRCLQCGDDFTRARATHYCSQKCCWLAQGRKAGHLPRAEVQSERRNPASWFKCEQCGKDAHRKMSGTNAAKGSRNRWCSMGCKVDAAKAARDAAPWPADRKTLCEYRAAYCAGCGDAFGSRNPDRTECKDCNERRRQASRAAASEARQALHRAVAKVTECQDCGIQSCHLYGSAPMEACPCCIAVRARNQKRVARTARQENYAAPMRRTRQSLTM